MSTAFFPDIAPQYADTELRDGDPDQDRARKYWCEAAYEEAQLERNEAKELRDVNTFIDYLCGRQWTGQNRPSYRAKPVDNEMVRLFWELVGILTDIRPVIQIRSTDRDEKCVKKEEVLNKATKAWWLNNDIDMKMAMNVVWGILTTSFVKQVWNPDLDMGDGELDFIPLGPSAVMPLRCSGHLDTSECLVYEEVASVAKLKRKFPGRAHLIKSDMRYSRFETAAGAPSNMSPMMFNLLSPQMKYKLGGQSQLKTSAFPMAKVREFWFRDYSINTGRSTVKLGRDNWAYVVKPGERLYPRGRLIIMVGTEIVDDVPSPYWHGLYPFSMLRLNIVPWQLYGLSDLRGWIDLQDIINQVLAGVLDLFKKAVNPGFYAPSNALSDEAWNNIDWSMPGARLKYKETGAGAPKFAPTPPVPPVAMPLLQYISRELKEQSGIAAISEMLKKKQIPSGDTMDQVKQLQSPPNRLKGRNIEVFVRDCGRRQVPNMLQFYTTKKRMFLLGAQGVTSDDYVDWYPETMLGAGEDPAQVIRTYKFIVEQGSLLSIQRSDKLMNAYRLWMAHGLSLETLYKIIDEPSLNYKDEIQRLQAEAKMGVQVMPPKKQSKAIMGGGGPAK